LASRADTPPCCAQRPATPTELEPFDDDASAPLLPPRGELHALQPPPGELHPLPTPPAPAPPPQPRSGPATGAARAALDRRHVARLIVRAALTSDVAVGAAGAFRAVQAVTCVAVLYVSRAEGCDNSDLLRLWLLVYAARCAALAHLLYKRHRLYKRGALARAGGPPQLARLRLRAEHAKAKLDQLGTLWFVMGALWLFGSADCATSAPRLTDLAAVWMLLGFASLFAPVVFFGALCCCLPPALAFLNAYGHVIGLRGADAASGADDPHAWIDELPVITFIPAPPPDAETGDATAEAPQAEPAAADDDEGESPRIAERPGSACSARSDGSGGAPVGGLLGKRYIAAEDAACAVCLGAYGTAQRSGAAEEGSRVALLPCGHHFHAPCIATWLRVNASCPLCKAPLGPRAAALDGDEDPAEAREAYLRAAVRGGDDILSVLV
jgi:hypothetical protein